MHMYYTYVCIYMQRASHVLLHTYILTRTDVMFQLLCAHFGAGTLIRRHCIPLPPPNDDKFYTVDHFNVGNEVTFYSKTFKITVCPASLNCSLKTSTTAL